MDFPGGSRVKNPPVIMETQKCSFDPWVRKIPWNGKWQPTLIILPGEFHGQRSLVGPWGSKELDMTENTHTHTHTHTHTFILLYKYIHVIVICTTFYFS